jgi:hypothetical protein
MLDESSRDPKWLLSFCNRGTILFRVRTVVVRSLEQIGLPRHCRSYFEKCRACPLPRVVYHNYSNGLGSVSQCFQLNATISCSPVASHSVHHNYSDGLGSLPIQTSVSTYLCGPAASHSIHHSYSNGLWSGIQNSAFCLTQYIFCGPAASYSVHHNGLCPISSTNSV